MIAASAAVYYTKHSLITTGKINDIRLHMELAVCSVNTLQSKFIIQQGHGADGAFSKKGYERVRVQCKRVRARALGLGLGVGLGFRIGVKGELTKIFLFLFSLDQVSLISLLKYFPQKCL